MMCSCLTLFTACEDAIDVDLDDNIPQLVVDAWVNSNPEPQTIRLTRTAPFFDNNFTPVITEATVVLTDDAGNTFSFLDNDNDGSYVWTPGGQQSLGQVGTTLQLTIDAEGETYTATSTIEPTTTVDSIDVRFRDDILGGPDGIYAELFARDLPGEGNAYWIQTFKNDQFLGLPEELNYTFDAAFTMGSGVDGVTFITPIRELINPVIENDESPYAPGDNIRVEIHSLNLAAFLFIDDLATQITLGNSSIFAEPPANVRTNIINVDPNATEQALGFFNVASVSEKTVIVP